MKSTASLSTLLLTGLTLIPLVASADSPPAPADAPAAMTPNIDSHAAALLDRPLKLYGAAKTIQIKAQGFVDSKPGHETVAVEFKYKPANSLFVATTWSGPDTSKPSKELTVSDGKTITTWDDQLGFPNKATLGEGGATDVPTAMWYAMAPAGHYLSNWTHGDNILKGAALAKTSKGTTSFDASVLKARKVDGVPCDGVRIHASSAAAGKEVAAAWEHVLWLATADGHLVRMEYTIKKGDAVSKGALAVKSHQLNAPIPDSKFTFVRP